MTKERIAKFCEKFNTHKATLIQDTDRYLIIDWRRADGSGDYYVNYIVDKKRGNLIVSGDLGDSIATWYNKIKPSNLKNYVKNDIEYYISKIQTASDLFCYDEKNVVESIKYNLKDFDSDRIATIVPVIWNRKMMSGKISNMKFQTAFTATSLYRQN